MIEKRLLTAASYALLNFTNKVASIFFCFQGSSLVRTDDGDDGADELPLRNG